MSALAAPAVAADLAQCGDIASGQVEPSSGSRCSRQIWLTGIEMATDLPDAVAQTLVILSTFMHSDGSRAWPGVAGLATRARRGESTIRRHLKTATSHGYLEVIARGHRKGNGTNHATHYAAALPLDVLHLVEVTIAERLLSTAHLGERLTSPLPLAQVSGTDASSSVHLGERKSDSLPLISRPQPLAQVSTHHQVQEQQTRARKSPPVARCPHNQRAGRDSEGVPLCLKCEHDELLHRGVA